MVPRRGPAPSFCTEFLPPLEAVRIRDGLPPSRVTATSYVAAPRVYSNPCATPKRAASIQLCRCGRVANPRVAGKSFESRLTGCTMPYLN